MDDYLEESSEEEEGGDYDEISPRDEKYKWPASFMAAPIYDRLETTDDDDTRNGADVPPRKIVGAITAEMPWHSYFQNLIPEGVDGIMGTYVCLERFIVLCFSCFVVSHRTKFF